MSAEQYESRMSDSTYNVMPGWRVGATLEEATRSGLLVPAGTDSHRDALPLVDIVTGQHFWAVPTGSWRFLWPPTGQVVVAVRDSQIIAEQDAEQDGIEDGNYL